MNPAELVKYLAINFGESTCIYFLPSQDTPVNFAVFYVVILAVHIIYKAF